MNSVMTSRLLYYFPVIKYLTILPKMVIPKTILIGIARRIAKNKVNLKTRNKRGKGKGQSENKNKQPSQTYRGKKNVHCRRSVVACESASMSIVSISFRTSWALNKPVL